MTHHPRRPGRKANRPGQREARPPIDICMWCRGMNGYHAPACEGETWKLVAGLKEGVRVYVAPAGTEPPR